MGVNCYWKLSSTLLTLFCNFWIVLQDLALSVALSPTSSFAMARPDQSLTSSNKAVNRFNDCIWCKTHVSSTIVAMFALLCFHSHLVSQGKVNNEGYLQIRLC